MAKAHVLWRTDSDVHLHLSYMLQGAALSTIVRGTFWHSKTCTVNPNRLVGRTQRSCGPLITAMSQPQLPRRKLGTTGIQASVLSFGASPLGSVFEVRTMRHQQSDHVHRWLPYDGHTLRWT